MRSDHLPLIATTRLVVGALGEQLGWWPTQFTGEAARRTLSMLFPRTPRTATLASVIEAARRVHDDALGPRTFHLFRLPVHLEDRLQGWLTKSEPRLAWPPATRDDALAHLAKLATKGAAAASGVGQVRLGKVVRLNHEPAFVELAAVYLQAARATTRVLPYFED